VESLFGLSVKSAVYAGAEYNSMVKCWFGAPLRKKLDSRKATETRLKLVGHNIRRVGYLEIMGDVVPHWRGCT